MMQVVFDLASEASSQELAQQLSPHLTPPLVLTFSGEIGSGKTTFIRAMLRALGERGAVRSPTFSLVESYLCRELTIHHFDLYRIQESVELEYIGFRDYFTPQSICCIEWPERASDQLSDVDIALHFVMKGAGRQVYASALSQIGFSVMSSWVEKA